MTDEEYPREEVRRRLLAGLGSIGLGFGAIATGVVVFGGEPGGDPCGDLENPIRGDGDPIAVDRRIRDEGVEYVESEQEVRYVQEGDGGLEKAVSVTDWVSEKTSVLGVDSVREAVVAALDDQVRGIDVAVARASSDGDVRIEVRWSSATTDASGADAPGIDVRELVAATPRSAEVTVGLEEFTATREIPVVVTCGTDT